MRSTTSDVDYGNFFRNLSSPHILIRADADLTLVDQNEAHAKIAFTRPQDVIGKPLLVAFPDTSEEYARTGVSELAESFKRVIATKKVDAMPLIKYDLHNTKGTIVERWWRVQHHPLFNDAGEVELVYQVTEDVTNEITARQQVDRTLGQLNSALAIGLVSIWSWDLQQNIITGDRNLAKSLCVTAAKARSGLPAAAFTASVHQDDQKRVRAALSATLTKGIEFSIDYRLVDAKHKVSWVKARGKIVKGIDGQPNIFTGVLINITDQKQAESKLEQIKLQYNALFNSTIVAIAMADTSGNILEGNKTFRRLFGYNLKDFHDGLTSKQVSFYKNDAPTNSLYDTLRSYGEAEPVRKEYVRKDGSRFTGLVGAAMLPGSTENFIAFIIDVSENEQLKELNRAKDDFVALASHQLRSPATTVKQYIGIMLNEMAGPLNEDQLQYLTIANNANNRQLTIIEDLLKTARIDTRGFSVNLHPRNLVAMTKNVIEQYDSVFDNRNQTVVFKTEAADLTIKADELELSTCIANLLENASKYSPIGSTITVSVRAEPKLAVLTITDQGVGIAKEHFEKVFEKFTRVDNELSDTVSGSGLGLYWVRRIIEVHGGTIKLQSTLGKGTTVVVRLPYE